MVVFLFNTTIYVFLLLGLCILIVRLPWMRFFRAFSSVVRQMPGYNLQRRGTARTLPYLSCSMYYLFLCCTVYCLFCVVLYCLCVVVYCTTATGWQPNCSQQIYHIISYHIVSYHIISYHIISYHIISYHIISYHIISYHIISYHISYHIISYITSYSFLQVFETVIQYV
jgi:hypothetical protein